MKVGSSKPSRGAGVTQSQTKGRASRNSPPLSGPPADESVRITSLSAQLSLLEASLAGVGEVDTARVEEIKRAISEGRFQIDSSVIAERLLDTVKELVLSGKA
ncbi:MAG: flagellar biosynthesis anti-sigma factor FlgM [Betaproteobacteria bacterium]|nr:flagellar biosynthesis anti-sigma factor FlgM [Betaproteobacteria bacterium]